jgi:type IV secretion system protein VirB8
MSNNDIAVKEGGESRPMKKAVKEARSWEASNAKLKAESEARAWWVAKLTSAIAILCVIAIVIMMPLKEPPVPYVLRENTATGHVEPLTVLNEKVMTGDEVRDKYWAWLYVQSRERYDWYTLQNDYETMGALSSAPEAKAYKSLFEGKNALDKKWGDKVRVDVRKRSQTMLSTGVISTRFVKTTTRLNDPNDKGTPTCWIATVGLDYLTPSRMNQKTRDINPWGFHALSYRVDPDVCDQSDTQGDN